METRCIPCQTQHDYGAPSAPNYVENGELSATATRALDDVLRRVDDAIARGWRRTGDDSVYVGADAASSLHAIDATRSWFAQETLAWRST